MPENQKLADIILTEMAEHLMLNPVFEDYCGMDIDKGIELLKAQGSVVEDTENAFVISYFIESEGPPFGIPRTNLRGHAYQLPFKEASEEEALEYFLKTAQHSGIIRDIGWYFIEQTVPSSIEKRAA